MAYQRFTSSWDSEERRAEAAGLLRICFALGLPIPHFDAIQLRYCFPNGCLCLLVIRVSMSLLLVT